MSKRFCRSGCCQSQIFPPVRGEGFYRRWFIGSRTVLPFFQNRMTDEWAKCKSCVLSSYYYSEYSDLARRQRRGLKPRLSTTADRTTSFSNECGLAGDCSSLHYDGLKLSSARKASFNCIFSLILVWIHMELILLLRPWSGLCCSMLHCIGAEGTCIALVLRAHVLHWCWRHMYCHFIKGSLAKLPLR